ncbi:hypothetical protein G7Y41_01970 [Schaalia sp. ZJ405]|uniref:hypothetical protein n=1 Tax=unclassified Schaalia TaxID=2691889 RepID=UPI0013EB312E|nr:MULTISPECIES: hypothetical protein [unclassified Schaalia]QPK81633.1 hypothetical protein G7Y41_01970 [Schaalia sp. ZJ405]
MASQKSTAPSTAQFLSDLGMHGAKKRSPFGQKLSAQERASLPILDGINEGVTRATEKVARCAHCADVAWIVGQFLHPMTLAARKKVPLPDEDLLLRVCARIEDLADGVDIHHPRGGAREFPRKKLTAALKEWRNAFAVRAKDPRWKSIEGTPVTLAGLRSWQKRMSSMDLTVIPSLEIPAEFALTLQYVEEWDEVLAQLGHTGECFSLREEVARLNNWPGDQWINGDDYASAQRRFHRRLKRARAISQDPKRDRIMERALYLREGLLLGPVDPLAWFLAVCRFRWETPEIFDPRPEIMSWRFVDWVVRIMGAHRATTISDVPAWIQQARDPRDVPAEFLTAVSGPNVMIDLDEDVVTALPPGCRVRRMVVSAVGPLGPDWILYWVESEWDDSRPILDLVESAKLHPQVIFVSDEEPQDLAEIIRPFLDIAYEIPTNPLTAHSHIPGVLPIFPEHPDAGL